MHDRPTAGELVRAVHQFIESELLPALSDQRLRFQTLVAINVLRIAERNLEHEEEDLRAECAELMALLGRSGSVPQNMAELRGTTQAAHAELRQRIRAGAYDDATAFAALAHTLRRQVRRKLVVANPRCL
jgi:hypothetical protein